MNHLALCSDVVGRTPDVTISNRVQCGNQVDIIITWTLLVSVSVALNVQFARISLFWNFNFVKKPSSDFCKRLK